MTIFVGFCQIAVITVILSKPFDHCRCPIQNFLEFGRTENECLLFRKNGPGSVCLFGNLNFDIKRRIVGPGFFRITLFVEHAGTIGEFIMQIDFDTLGKRLFGNLNVKRFFRNKGNRRFPGKMIAEGFAAFLFMEPVTGNVLIPAATPGARLPFGVGKDFFLCNRSWKYPIGFHFKLGNEFETADVRNIPFVSLETDDMFAGGNACQIGLFFPFGVTGLPGVKNSRKCLVGQ